LRCGKREVEDGSPDTVTPVTLETVTPVAPTDNGFTNHAFICDGGINLNRGVDHILSVNGLAVRKTIRQSLNGVIGPRPDLPRIAYFGS
jgi:hypothetical protein